MNAAAGSSDLALWQALGVALAIGLLVGAERERSQGGSGSAGIRTFTVVAVIGALAVLVPPAPAAVLLAGVVLLVAIGYADSEERDRGTTTEVALLATAGLGALAPSHPPHAVALAVVLTVVLASKESLHHFVRDTVTDQERNDALKFFVAAFVVLPLLPRGRVGPYGVWVPQRVWLLVVVITGIGWLGHAATRAVGVRRGLLVTGLAGGFVSGTATTGAMAARTRSGTPTRLALAAASMASVATLVQLVVLTTLVAPALGLRLLPGAVAGALVLVVEAVLLSRGARLSTTDGGAPPRPFALLPAVVLAAVISLVLLLATWLDHRYGAVGSTVVAAVGSLADVHASAVAIASLVRGHALSLGAAVTAIAVGLATNTGSKLVAALVGGPAFAGRLFVLLLPAAAVFAGATLVVP